MRARFLILSTVLFVISALQSASAIVITSDLTNVSGNTWQANYTVTNDALAEDIELFAIYFNDADYDNLSLVSIPDNWLEFILQPGEFFAGEDGFFEVEIDFGFSGIGSGESLSGFILEFEYFGSELPTSEQGVEVYDLNALDFIPIDTGVTPALTNNVNAPSAFLFLSLGIAFFARQKWKGTE